MADLQTEGLYRQNTGTFHEKENKINNTRAMRTKFVGGKKF